ncbi:MAG TPA: DUF72 domain-containing protein [Asanoa sp.]
MGEIKVGTASWTDKTLLASGWYPADADTPEKRLAYYAGRFPLVEVDSTYYSPPAEQTAALWAARTPPGFTFNIKAYSLLTGHPTRVASLYKDLRPETAKANVYPKDLPAQAYEDVWTRFLSALDPLIAAGKLGALLFQFPPWFTIRRSNKQYLLEVQKRVAPLVPVVELRHASWFEGDNRDETIEFLRRHRLAYVSVDMPQGYRSSIPPVLEATADLAVVRFHGHSDKWTSKDIYEKFGYEYSKAELADWAPRLRALAGETGETHVLMNNCYSSYAQTNAQQLLDLLGEDEDGGDG